MTVVKIRGRPTERIPQIFGEVGIGNIGLTNDSIDRRRALERYRVRVTILTDKEISVECTLAPKPETIPVKDYADMDAVMAGREDVVANSISVPL